MKESKLIEMDRHVAILGRAVDQMIKDIEFIKTMVVGDHQVIKRLKEFPEIIEQIKDEHGKEKDASGATTGNSGSTDTGFELE